MKGAQYIKTLIVWAKLTCWRGKNFFDESWIFVRTRIIRSDLRSSTPNFNRGCKILSVRLRQSFFLSTRVIYAPNSPDSLFRVHGSSAIYRRPNIGVVCMSGDFPSWEIYRRTFARIAIQGVSIITSSNERFCRTISGVSQSDFPIRDEQHIETLRHTY